MPRLELKEDPQSEDSQRTAQRVGWVVLAILIAAAAAGILPYATQVAQAGIVYLGMLLLVRLAGRRTLANLSSFDLILLLIISEAISPAFTGDHVSDVARPFVVAATLVGIDIALAYVKIQSPRLAAWIDGQPVVLMRDGRVADDQLRASRVSRDDLLSAGRAAGVGSLDEVEHAVLEANGEISILSATPVHGKSKSDPIF